MSITTFHWVNKTQDSSSLSNCRNEKEALSKIRSHTLTAAHKSRHVARYIKRTSLNLGWTQKVIRSSPINEIDSRPTRAQEHRWQDSHPGTNIIKEGISGKKLMIHCLQGTVDPFSSYPIELDTAALDYLWYFGNIWTHCAFKLPGCVGYGQEPIEQCEVSTIIQECFSSETRGYCLLAAASARMQYIHHPGTRGGGRAGRLAHSYAARGLNGIRRWVEEQNGKIVTLSEADATNMLFLAAYEVFCSDDRGAESHLIAVRRLYKQEISNNFMRRLQANLDILVTQRIHAVDKISINPVY
jgi:hypothetical protein